MSLSIFRKKGTVESLFRIGLGGEHEARPAPLEQADASDVSSQHQVFLVRGRPFIANAQSACTLPRPPVPFSATPCAASPRVRSRSAPKPKPLTLPDRF